MIDKKLVKETIMIETNKKKELVNHYVDCC